VAASMLRLRSNWMVTEVELSELVDVICVMPGIWANCLSSGCATDVAMVSGWRRGEWPIPGWSGSPPAAAARPAIADRRPGDEQIPAISSDVAMGYLINGAEMLSFIFMGPWPGPAPNPQSRLRPANRAGPCTDGGNHPLSRRQALIDHDRPSTDWLTLILRRLALSSWSTMNAYRPPLPC